MLLETIVITVTIEAAAMLQKEADEVFGAPHATIDEFTGFQSFKPILLSDEVEPKIWLDDLVSSKQAEVMTVAKLLATHTTSAHEVE